MQCASLIKFLFMIKSILRKILPYSIILWTHKIRAVIAVLIYGFPAKKLIVIGVAGTKGKTTSCNLIAKILEEGGHKVAMFSTANLKIGKREWLNKTKMTTPSCFFIQKFLRQAVKEKCDYAVIETSSHGLVQHRHFGIDYKIVVLTNLMPDHLDYHKTFENYRDAHLKLFTPNLKTAVINKDDDGSAFFLKFPAKEKYTFTIIDKSAVGNENFRSLQVVNYKLNSDGSSFIINVFVRNEHLRSIKINLSLRGKFNIYNALAAIGVGISQGIELEKIKSALEKIKGVPGRLEKIKVNNEQSFEVIVDYAHSPDSLKSFYETVALNPKGKIIAVLGACGDRDKTVRPTLGKLAAEYADFVIITNEDPYSEKPKDIIKQVASGVEEILNEQKNSKIPNSPPAVLSAQPMRAGKFQIPNYKVQKYFKILDRKEAIEKAIDLADKNDLVLITGKGAEQWIVSGNKKIPWDDREVAREAIRKKLEKKKED
jgi:UDP-N-acetylmuramoyl-L-alanyl-D-glutamate--2,6-diaminopimelate ligase